VTVACGPLTGDGGQQFLPIRSRTPGKKTQLQLAIPTVPARLRRRYCCIPKKRSFSQATRLHLVALRGQHGDGDRICGGNATDFSCACIGRLDPTRYLGFRRAKIKTGAFLFLPSSSECRKKDRNSRAHENVEFHGRAHSCRRRPAETSSLEKMGTISQRATDRPRGLQRQRRRLELLHPRPGPLAARSKCPLTGAG
jgi:hypothetical protein